MFIVEDFGCYMDDVNVKVIIMEKLGFIGCGEGIVCEVVVLFIKVIKWLSLIILFIFMVNCKVLGCWKLIRKILWWWKIWVLSLMVKVSIFWLEFLKMVVIFVLWWMYWWNFWKFMFVKLVLLGKKINMLLWNSGYVFVCWVRKCLIWVFFNWKVVRCWSMCGISVSCV